MSTSALKEIESQFAEWSPEAQLNLLERLVHHVRAGWTGSHGVCETDLSAMAADPEMQRELRRINAEFSAAEADRNGLPLLPTPFARPEPLCRPPAGKVSGAVLQKIEIAVRHCLGLQFTLAERAVSMNKQHVGSDLDAFLKQDGLLAECEAGALKRVVAWQMSAR